MLASGSSDRFKVKSLFLSIPGFLNAPFLSLAKNYVISADYFIIRLLTFYPLKAQHERDFSIFPHPQFQYLFSTLIFILHKLSS